MSTITSPIRSPLSSAIRNVFLPSRGGAPAFDPTALFSSGEQGAIFDPSNLSTAFQGSDGVSPASVGQAVGLLLDTKAAITSLSTSAWAKNSGDGVVTVVGNVITITGATTTTRVDVTPSDYAVNDHLELVFTANIGGAVSPLLYLGGVFTSVSAGAQTARARATGTFTRLQVDSGTATFTVTSRTKRTGNHAAQSTGSQKPILRLDGNGKHYLEFDGIDDSLITGSVSFASTDAVSIFAGVRKSSDSSIGVVAELSATIASNNGAFLLTAPASAAAATYAFYSKGTAQVDAVGSGFAAPITSVLSAHADISSDIALIRVNGVQADTDAGDQGTGNFGNYPIYIGRRNSTSLPLNGRVYQLIIRGATTDVATIAAAESYINSKTGAY